MLAIILILGGLTGILYWATYAPEILSEKFDENCDPNTSTWGCTMILLIGYFFLISLIIGGAVGLLAGKD